MGGNGDLGHTLVNEKGIFGEHYMCGMGRGNSLWMVGYSSYSRTRPYLAGNCRQGGGKEAVSSLQEHDSRECHQMCELSGGFGGTLNKSCKIAAAILSTSIQSLSLNLVVPASLCGTGGYGDARSIV